MRDCIQLAACGANEILPMNPNLPADLFTSCLTTPIEIAIRYFILQNPLMTSLSLDVVDKIPGAAVDRHSIGFCARLSPNGDLDSLPLVTVTPQDG